MRLTAVLILATSLGAVAWSACGGASTVAGAAVEFDQQRAWRDVEALVALGPRPAGSDALEAARIYIEQELAQAGLEPIREPFVADTPIGEIPMANIYVDLMAPDTADGPAPVIVVCTHIDTKILDFEFVGANDSASGTAVLLELARVMAGRKGDVTYRLLFIDGEESIRREWVDPDNRYGSRHHVLGLKRSGWIDRVGACVLLDLIGDKDLRLSTEQYSDSQLQKIFFDAAREAGLGAHVGGPRLPIKDDHLSFMAAGIRCVDLIDFEYGPANSYWHSPEDTLENVSAESLGIIGRIVLLGLPAVEKLLL